MARMTQSFTYDALPGRVVFGAGSFDRVAAELAGSGAVWELEIVMRWLIPARKGAASSVREYEETAAALAAAAEARARRRAEGEG